MHYGKRKLIFLAIFALSGCAGAQLKTLTLCDSDPVHGGYQCVPEDKSKPAFFLPYGGSANYYSLTHEDFKAFAQFCRIQVKGQ